MLCIIYEQNYEHLFDGSYPTTCIDHGFCYIYIYISIYTTLYEDVVGYLITK